MSASLFGGGNGARMELGGRDNPHYDFGLEFQEKGQLYCNIV